LNNKRHNRKHSNIWRLKKTLFHDQWIIEEIMEEIKKFPGIYEKESTTYQNLWDTAKTVLDGKFIIMSAYIKNTERSQIT
jgi:hypothetical protein